MLCRAIRTPCTGAEVGFGSRSPFRLTSINRASRLATQLHVEARVEEAVEMMERFVSTQNPLHVSHLLVAWYEELEQPKQAKKWMEYGFKHEEPEVLRLMAE